MKEINTEIVINTQSSRVWDILTDLDKYVAWNPFIREAEGDIEEGAKLRIYIAPPDSKGMAFKPRVTRVVENSELRWQGKYIIPGLFDGEHIFELIPLTQNSVKLVQREIFRGILIPFLWKKIEKSTIKGFNIMNEAIKRRAESRINS